MPGYQSIRRCFPLIWASLIALTACASVQRPNPALVPTSQLRAQSAVQSPQGLQRFLSGSAVDQQPALQGPNLLLAGGGQDQVAAMQWQIDNLRGCRDCDRSLDMVVLRSSGSNGYNSMIGELKGVDSIETLVITERDVAQQADIAETVARAELVFFAGGDQCRYVQLFKNTALERAVKSVFARGGGVGGTSAGLAIQGAMVYDACQGSVTSEEALSDPFHADISFTQDFLDWPQLGLTLTDTHFAQRNRMGRLMAFLARGAQITGGLPVRGIAVDEATALAVDRNAQATVFGRHQVYLVDLERAPQELRPGQTLNGASFRIKALQPGEVIDLKQRFPSGAYPVEVNSGHLSANPYRP